MPNTGNKKVDSLLFELGQQTKATMLVQIREDNQVEYWITGSILRGEGAPDKQRFPFLQKIADKLQEKYDEYRADNPPHQGDKKKPPKPPEPTPIGEHWFCDACNDWWDFGCICGCQR